MGRKVKLSDVKLFEVFIHNNVEWVKLTNGVCLINLGHVIPPSANHIVKVIGRMEFKEE